MYSRDTVRRAKSFQESVYTFLKENKDTWYSTEDLSKVFDRGLDDMSKLMNKLLHNGSLVMNKWEHEERIVSGYKKRVRVRMWKADLD